MYQFTNKVLVCMNSTQLLALYNSRCVHIEDSWLAIILYKYTIKIM